jgi:hypothetical protein
MAMDGLTSAGRIHGNKFAYNVGRKKLSTNLAAQVKESLAGRVLSLSN